MYNTLILYQKMYAQTYQCRLRNYFRIMFYLQSRVSAPTPHGLIHTQLIMNTKLRHCSWICPTYIPLECRCKSALDDAAFGTRNLSVLCLA